MAARCDPRELASLRGLVNWKLLLDLSALFTFEAFEADKCGDPNEADRLWDISEELGTKYRRERRRELREREHQESRS